MSEEIKYEAVFGDQSLFDGVSCAAIIVIKSNSTGRYTITENECSDIVKLNVCQPDIEIAMRRIIKTPVWTKADQQAGKLPEVGAIIHFTNDIKDVEFAGSSADRKSWVFKCSDGSMMFAPESCFKPIETPEERAKREEDEFVKSILKNEMPDSSQLWLDAVAFGARATYRKLKMTEL